jgi:hypothetical protein
MTSTERQKREIRETSVNEKMRNKAKKTKNEKLITEDQTITTNKKKKYFSYKWKRQ